MNRWRVIVKGYLMTPGQFHGMHIPDQDIGKGLN